jgi:hypothetical protein
MRARYWLIGFLAMAAGCSASHQPAPAPTPEKGESTSSQESSQTGLPVRVDNQNFNDMNIYFLSAGQRYLLGSAGGLGETTLTIPSGLAPTDGRVRLEAAPLGGMRAIFTPTLVVAPGQSVFWTIGSDAGMSTASVG